MLLRLVVVVVAAFVLAIGVYLVTGTGTEDAPETSYVGTYRSALLPAASSPGRIIMLEVKQDGTFIMKTDFQNGEPVIQQEGQWVTDAGAMVVTISTTNGNLLFRPVRFSLVMEGSVIKTVGSPELFGSEGITLTKSGP